MELPTPEIYHDIVQKTEVPYCKVYICSSSSVVYVPATTYSASDPWLDREQHQCWSFSLVSLFFLQKCFLVFCFLWFVQENHSSFKFSRRSQMRDYFSLWLLKNKLPWYNPERAVLCLWTLKFSRYFFSVSFTCKPSLSFAAWMSHLCPVQGDSWSF